MIMLDEKYNNWKRTLNRNTVQKKEEKTKTHHFKNPKTGRSITSIYPDVEEFTSYIKDGMDYVKHD